MYLSLNQIHQNRSAMYDALIQMPVEEYQEMAVEFGFAYFENGEFNPEISIFDLACFLLSQNRDPSQIAKGNWR